MSTKICLKYLVLKLNQIRHLHIELSSKCQAACPLCERNLYGYYERPDFGKKDLTLNQIKQIFDKVELNIEDMYFNGNFGDPCINTELGDIAEYFFNKFPKLTQIGISTNGGMQKPDWWFNLAQRFNQEGRRLKINFSIEGLEDTNHLYRINVPYSKVIENAKAFIAGGGYANWKWIEFKHNQHQLETARQISKDLGFRSFTVSDHCRDDGYVKTGEDSFYLIEPADYKNINFRIPQMEVKNGDYVAYENFRKELAVQHIEDKKESWISSKKLDCYHLNDRSVYINSLGELYPCCFLGFNPKTFINDRNPQLKEILSRYSNNLLSVDWQTAIDWFNEIYTGWKKDTVDEGMILGCLMTCHTCKK